MRHRSRSRHRRLIAVASSALLIGSTVAMGLTHANAEVPSAGVLDKDKILVVNLSGRGDKDMEIVAAQIGITL